MPTSLLEEIPPQRRTPIPGVADALQRRQCKRAGRAYSLLCWSVATVFAGVLVGLVASLAAGSAQGFSHSGLSLLWSGTWDPVRRVYGAATFVVGTVVTTFVALVLAVPVGLASATFLSDLAPGVVAQPVCMLIDLIAAIPGIVVGLWGLLVLSPAFARHVEPFLGRVPVFQVLFRGPALGPSMLLAGVILAIMVLPTIVALSRTALNSVSTADREAALALGATRWQVIRRVVIPGARSGIEASVTLATGRALGESIAVAMVIGNRYTIPHGLGTILLSPGATLGSAVINSFGAASPGLQRSEVISLVAILLGISAFVNAGGQFLLRRRRRQPRGPA